LDINAIETWLNSTLKEAEEMRIIGAEANEK